MKVMMSFELMSSSSNYGMIQLKEFVASSKKILCTLKKTKKAKKYAKEKSKKKKSNALAL